jgi:hypothetical protein
LVEVSRLTSPIRKRLFSGMIPLCAGAAIACPYPRLFSHGVNPQPKL